SARRRTCTSAPPRRFPPRPQSPCPPLPGGACSVRETLVRFSRLPLRLLLIGTVVAGLSGAAGLLLQGALLGLQQPAGVLRLDPLGRGGRGVLRRRHRGRAL